MRDAASAREIRGRKIGVLGAISARKPDRPLVATVVKPLRRGAVKTTVGIGIQVKTLAEEAAEELQDLAAEAGAEVAPAEPKKARATPAAATVPAVAKKA